MKNVTKGLLMALKWMTIAINLVIVFMISTITLPIAWMINYDALAVAVKKYALNLMIIPAGLFALFAYNSNYDTIAGIGLVLVPTLAMVNAMKFKEIK